MAVCLGLLMLTVPTGVRACGINWTLPQSHFDGVDEQGRVNYTEKIGDLDLGEGLVIPLYILFECIRVGNPV